MRYAPDSGIGYLNLVEPNHRRGERISDQLPRGTELIQEQDLFYRTINDREKQRAALIVIVVTEHRQHGNPDRRDDCYVISSAIDVLFLVIGQGVP